MKKLFFILLFSLCVYANSSWHKDNLYDKITLSYYIPFELWLQVPWDGKKNRTFNKMQPNHHIQGYYDWYHPYLKKHVKAYKKVEDSKTALYTFYPKGVAKVFEKEGEVYLNNGIHFPAGFGWKTDKIYKFNQEIWIKDKHYIRTTAIRIQNILFDEQNHLKSLSFDFFINGTLKNRIQIRPIKN